MFGFKSKVKSVLRDQFNYIPGPFQGPIFKTVCREANRKGVNEYDAAIMFMMVQMNSLSGDGDDVKTFVRSHVNNIRNVLSHAQSPSLDIAVMLSEIEAKYGLASVQA